MKSLSICLLMLFALCGCSSGGGGVMPNEEASAVAPQMMLPQANRWTWDTGLYRVSEDHTSIERISNRTADLHFNVNPFVEPPNCKHCLMIGKPEVQPDGTIKVKVMLTHPFPGQLKYTGFDVRGTIMFPATRYWKGKGMPLNVLETVYGYQLFEGYIPLNFSRAEDGGGQLLNADGYTMFLFPGFDLGPEFAQPIFNYSKGKYAYGPDPDSTINPFKLFTNDPERRMFLPNESISRVYHIAPPAGEFIFGYVVDASWVPPTNTPVNDPKSDFPYYANCEDGYILSSEQTAPFKLGTYDTDGGTDYPSPYKFLQVTFLAHPEVIIYGYCACLICPDLTSDNYLKTHGVGSNHGASWIKKIGNGIYSADLRIGPCWEFPNPGPPYTYDGEPGNHIALVFIVFVNWYPPNPSWVPQQLVYEPLFDFINLEVVEGD